MITATGRLNSPSHFDSFECWQLPDTKLVNDPVNSRSGFAMMTVPRTFAMPSDPASQNSSSDSNDNHYSKLFASVHCILSI